MEDRGFLLELELFKGLSYKLHHWICIVVSARVSSGVSQKLENQNSELK